MKMTSWLADFIFPGRLLRRFENTVPASKAQLLLESIGDLEKALIASGNTGTFGLCFEGLYSFGQPLLFAGGLYCACIWAIGEFSLFNLYKDRIRINPVLQDQLRAWEETKKEIDLFRK